MTGPRVAVIGAGPSGLTAARQLAKAGLEEVTVFEKGSQVGGNWVYTREESHSSVFETTHIISSKRLSQYAEFPMPAHYPDYPSHRQLLAYFEDYARHFGLTRVIRFGVEVVQAVPAGDHWELVLADGSRERFDHVLVASGHHWLPRWPEYPGTYTGRWLHSHDFKTNESFRGERVLVIGGGNSACDIAVETGRVAAATAISWRRGYYVIPKLVFGTPPDVLAARTHWLPAALRRRLLRLTWRLSTGGFSPYGLPEPDHDILASHPVVNSELLYFIRHGRVHPRPDLARLEGRMVEFSNGSREEFDSVICATGFRIAFPFLPPGVADFGDGDVPLYLRVFHPDHPSLHFIGLVQPQGCIWPLAEAQAELAALRITGRWAPPDDMRARVAADVAGIRRRYTASPRHSVEVDYHDHLATLRREIRRAHARPSAVTA